jgi:hypothetical protein
MGCLHTHQKIPTIGGWRIVDKTGKLI